MKKLMITSALFLAMSTAYATPQQDVLQKIFTYFSELKQQPLSMKKMQSFYTPNVVMITNNQRVARGYQDYYAHFQKMLHFADNYQFVFAKHAFTQQHNRVVAQYTIKAYKDHQVKSIPVIAIFTFHGKRISRWDEVVANFKA